MSVPPALSQNLALVLGDIAPLYTTLVYPDGWTSHLAIRLLVTLALGSEACSALRLVALAEAKLTELAKQRDELPDTSYLMGRLYFQTGAVHAIHFEDHTMACAWYDRAADLLLNPVPVTTMAGPQQHGDALVSMGVSYWHEKYRQRAIELTQSGVDLIEQAVEKGILSSDSLAVPYGNLAAMYEAQGQRGPAAKYTRLAKQLKGQTTQQRR